jgi:nucleotide-binding universal stress UspA family protein
MTLKSILLHLADSPRTEIRIEAAIGLARRHDAHLTGIFVAPLHRWPASMEGRIPEQYREQIVADEAKRAAELRKSFQEACRRDGVVAAWREARGDAATIVADQARYADLIVVGQADPEQPASDGGGIPEDLVFMAGRPALVVPYVGHYRVIGEHALIAWKSGRESARAVKDALPLLEKAKTVTVLSVNADDSAHYPGQDLAAYLARHGVKAEARKTVAGDIDVADVVLSTAADIGADLLVMGAYSRSRLREAVLGGVTRDVLDRMTLPTLLSH